MQFSCKQRGWRLVVPYRAFTNVHHMPGEDNFSGEDLLSAIKIARRPRLWRRNQPQLRLGPSRQAQQPAIPDLRDPRQLMRGSGHRRKKS